MKILLAHSLPFSLAHGGTQTVVNEIMAAYRRLGVDADFERWWMDEQPCNLIHSFGRPGALNVDLARDRGIATVMTEYLDQVSSRPRWYRALQKGVVGGFGKLLPASSIDRLGWRAYRTLDAMVFTTEHEWRTAQYIFGARKGHGHIVPHGLRAAALSALSQPAKSGDYLVSIATITPRKNSLLLAQLAHANRVPVHFLGKPYADDDYFRGFMDLVDGKWVHYHGFVEEKKKNELLTQARGFVLLSQFESGCVAVYEAAAAGLPLLLPALPWAKTGYPDADGLSFVPLKRPADIGKSLVRFYEESRRADAPTFRVHSWDEIAELYLDVYHAAMERRPHPERA